MEAEPQRQLKEGSTMYYELVIHLLWSPFSLPRRSNLIPTSMSAFHLLDFLILIPRMRFDPRSPCRIAYIDLDDVATTCLSSWSSWFPFWELVWSCCWYGSSIPGLHYCRFAFQNLMSLYNDPIIDLYSLDFSTRSLVAPVSFGAVGHLQVCPCQAPPQFQIVSCRSLSPLARSLLHSVHFIAQIHLWTLQCPLIHDKWRRTVFGRCLMALYCLVTQSREPIGACTFGTVSGRSGHGTKAHYFYSYYYGYSILWYQINFRNWVQLIRMELSSHCCSLLHPCLRVG